MVIDIRQVFSEMVDSLGEDAIEMRSAFNKALEHNQQSIKALIQAKIDGDINSEDFERELEREKMIVEVEMLGLEIASKSAIQKAINGAMGVLSKAVLAVT